VGDLVEKTIKKPIPLFPQKEKETPWKRVSKIIKTAK
jgi:hypothetical protein